MTITPDQMCFGLSSQFDQESFSCFLQLAGRREFADVLAGRLSSEEIDTIVDAFMRLFRRHLAEDEYHRLFLGDTAPHHN